MLVPELAQLAADQADQLGGYRIWELRAAMAALGVTDIRFLGGPGRYRDSGMIGHAGERAPAGLLERRPRRGRRARGRRRPRGPAAGRRHLRRERRLRPPRPHPGPPRRDGRGRGRRRPRLPARPRRAVGRWRRSTGRPCRARCCRRASTRWPPPATTSVLRGRHRRRRHPLRRAGRAGHRRRRRPARSHGSKDAAMRAHPTQITGRRAVLRAVEQPRPGGARRRVLPAGAAASAARPARPGRVGGRPVRRPGAVTGPRACCAAVWRWLGRRRRGRRRGLARAGRGVLAAAAGRPACWCRCRSPAAVVGNLLLVGLALRLTGSRAGRGAAGAHLAGRRRRGDGPPARGRPGAHRWRGARRWSAWPSCCWACWPRRSRSAGRSAARRAGRRRRSGRRRRRRTQPVVVAVVLGEAQPRVERQRRGVGRRRPAARRSARRARGPRRRARPSPPSPARAGGAARRR